MKVRASSSQRLGSEPASFLQGMITDRSICAASLSLAVLSSLRWAGSPSQYSLIVSNDIDTLDSCGKSHYHLITYLTLAYNLDF